ncbi:MAG: AsmA family protein, partial [Pluralibacter sp.]|nr:AsmA family protein [Pluralibacter sp.]
LNGAAATFNRVDVRRPSLKLTANPNTVSISELSAFTEKGILEAAAAVSQQPQRQIAINLNGRGVPLNILEQWGWPALPVMGDGNFQLSASGNVQADAPLKPTVSGKLHAVNMDKQEVTQTMAGGVVSTAPSPATAPSVPSSPQP